MNKTIILFLMVTSLAGYAQTPVTDASIAFHQAKVLLNPKSPKYNPKEAFVAFNKLALQGNAEAMNGLALLYSKGIGTPEDQKEAFSWFNKSAAAGYGGAYYNLGLLIKDGITAPQDFNKAYSLFTKGAALNNGNCFYGQAYMLYKGYGCSQNYTKAAALFKKAAALDNEGAYYMLGLCYRNGYGTAANADSAKYWLRRAAEYHDQRAIDELASKLPENADLKDVPNLQPASAISGQRVNLKAGFNQVEHHVAKGDIAGDYTGYTIKFDWSGKHIIGQAMLKLHLERKDQAMSGEWQEEGQDPVTLNATLTDTGIVFNNTSYRQIDHYHKATPLLTEFKASHLNLVKSRDTVYLTGTLRKYSTILKEPQKPEFIMLIRTDGKHDYPKADAAFGFAANAKADSVHFVAYPNPFAGNLQLRYTLKKAARVSIIVSNLLNGRIVYRSEEQYITEGDHNSVVAFNGEPGNYIVTLQYGNKVKSAFVIKQ